jgi:hypothetical protein
MARAQKKIHHRIINDPNMIIANLSATKAGQRYANPNVITAEETAAAIAEATPHKTCLGVSIVSSVKKNMRNKVIV